MIWPQIVVMFMWVVLMCQILSLYQLIVFTAFPTFEFSEAEKIGIYTLCLLVFPIACFILPLMLVSIVKIFKSKMLKKVLLGIGGIKGGLIVLGGVGVVIWRLFESAEQRVPIGIHLGVYTLMSPLFIVAIKAAGVYIPRNTLRFLGDLFYIPY